MERIPTSEPMASPQLRGLYGYWLSARKGRAMPARADLDPVDIPNLLPNVMLADVFRAPLRFRYRLIGTAITTISRRDVTGRWIDEELYGDQAADMVWAFATCVETRQPLAVRESAVFVAKRDWAIVEALLLPLGVTDDIVDMVFGGVDLLKTDVEPPPRGTGYILNLEGSAG